MITTLRSEERFYHESLMSLYYSERTKLIRNTTQVSIRLIGYAGACGGCGAH